MMHQSSENRLRKCPYCATPCQADWVDVGVGKIQCGPYVCFQCGAYEKGPCDGQLFLTEEQVRLLNRHLWYPPGCQLHEGIHAIDDRPITCDEAKEFYRTYGYLPKCTESVIRIYNDSEYQDYLVKIGELKC